MGLIYLVDFSRNKFHIGYYILFLAHFILHDFFLLSVSNSYVFYEVGCFSFPVNVLFAEEKFLICSISVYLSTLDTKHSLNRFSFSISTYTNGLILYNLVIRRSGTGVVCHIKVAIFNRKSSHYILYTSAEQFTHQLMR